MNELRVSPSPPESVRPNVSPGSSAPPAGPMTANGSRREDEERRSNTPPKTSSSAAEMMTTKESGCVSISTQSRFAPLRRAAFFANNSPGFEAALPPGDDRGRATPPDGVESDFTTSLAATEAPAKAPAG